MVEVRSARALQLSCGSRESGQSAQFSVAGDPSLDACASASQSKTPAHLASLCRSCGPLASRTCHPSSLSQSALRRQTSEVRAACSNPARADPCGGRQATDVPTATLTFGVNPSRGTLAIVLNPDSSAWGQRPLPQEYEPARQAYSGCRNRPCSWGENNKRLPPWQRADPQLHPSLRLRLFSLLHPAPDRSLLPSHGDGESLCRRVRSPSG